MKGKQSWVLAILVIIGLTIGTFSFALVCGADGCAGVQIRNDSSTSIDEALICEATEQWVKKGFQVYVFVTDQDPGTEEAWYAIRDEVEPAWGIYDPANDTFAKGALAIELTTDTSHPWGHDLAFGEYLFGTSLDDDAVIGRLEGQLKNGVSRGEVTEAIVNLLNESYQIAFPLPTLTPEPIPTVVVTGPTTIHETKVDFGPLVRGFFIILTIAVVLVAGYFLVTRLAVPVLKKMSRRKQLNKQKEDQRARCADLLNACEGLLKGDSAQNTLLYQLWASYGGARYQRRDAEVLEYLRRSQEALTRAFEVWNGLVHPERSEVPQELEGLVKVWETLYLTLVGTNERILAMTWDEQKTLLDPMLVLEREETDVQLVTQLDNILREQQGAGSLRIDLMVIQPEEVDAEGILGYIDQVKQAMSELREAREEAPRLVSEAQSQRQRLGESVQIPFGLKSDEVFAYPDTLIAQAEEALTGKLWLDAQEGGEAALRALAEIPESVSTLRKAHQAIEDLEISKRQGMPGLDAVRQPLRASYQQAGGFLSQGQYSETVHAAEAIQANCARANAIVVNFERALEGHDRRQGQIEEIESQGFRLDSVQADLKEIMEDILAVGEALRRGDYARAEEFLEELTVDGDRALWKAERLVALHEANEKELRRLSSEVAGVEEYRRSVVEPAWETLCVYPRSNWSGVANNFSMATTTLQRLFDDPADEHDLTSNIGRVNSMEVQEFERAEEMLDKAFVDLQQSEQQLKALVTQLSEVQQLEGSLQETLKVVALDIQKARTRRDQDNEKIDAAVDQMIVDAEAKLTKAEKAVHDCDFTTANQLLSEAKELAHKAYASADEQAKAIEELMARLSVARSQAEEIVRQAEVDYASLTPSAQKASTGGIVNKVTDSLREARRAESATKSVTLLREDHVLFQMLQKSVSLYERAEQAGREALGEIAADKREYASCISSVQEVISSAQSAIRNASRYTQDSDAGGGGLGQSAGSSALRRARSIIPSVPRYGESLVLLERKRREAEEARSYAAQAQRQARSRIAEVEAAREAERRRREAQERRRREAEERRRREEQQRRSSSSSFGSSTRSRSSSLGSSARSRSGSMGSSRRR